MWQKYSIVWSAIAIIAVVGCGKSQQPGTGEASRMPGARSQQAAQLEGPAAAVFEFLNAVRSGNDDKVAQMLTVAARENTAKLNMVVAPPGSDTAEFIVGSVQYLSQDGARVASTWSDLDENSNRKTDEVLWMLRREASGWRIAGVATPVFEGEPPLLLNFEDPEDMIRKQKWVRQEAIRRAKAGKFQATGENSKNSMRR